MKRLTDDIIQFFHNQNFVVVSTLDKDGNPHNACKGIVKMNRSGRVYLLDLYRQRTYQNLRQNPHISITAVDEHRFTGYCLKGRARLMPEKKLRSHIMRAWEERITSRITHRILKNLREEKGHPKHPEALLPKPQYLIIMDVDEVVNLTPHHLKAEG